MQLQLRASGAAAHAGRARGSRPVSPRPPTAADDACLGHPCTPLAPQRVLEDNVKAIIKPQYVDHIPKVGRHVVPLLPLLPLLLD